jgi:pimeloyl-ACP methyl ester carboxylesterase
MFIQANGLELEVDDRGPRDGEPLLLIMGLGAQLVHWPDRFVDQLVARGFRVIRFDNRDVGRSTRIKQRVGDLRLLIAQRAAGVRPRAAYTILDMADDAAGVLDALGVPSAHVMGLSMGGMIGQTMAVAHPRRVRSLVSIMSAPGTRRSIMATPIAIRALFGPAPRNLDEAIASEERLFRAVGGRGRHAPDAAQVRECAALAWERGYSPGGFIRQFAAILASGDRRAGLATVRAPTSVIHGSVDTLVPPLGGRLTAAAIPGARFRLVPDMGHDIPPSTWSLVLDELAIVAARA